jgi:uncharacterized membrane protein
MTAAEVAPARSTRRSGPLKAIRFKYLPSRVAGRRSPNLAAVIYGTILATAGVASMHESGSVTAARAFGVLLATGAVIWAARVYAYLLAERLQGKRRMQRGDVSRVSAREWPIFQATLPLSLPLALGAMGVLGTDAAFSFATLIGVAMLVGWGVVFSHRAGHGVAGLVGAAALNSLVGLLIVGLELAIP